MTDQPVDKAGCEDESLMDVMEKQNCAADILIVDDVHANVFLMENMLNDRYLVDSVESAAAMWKYLKHQMPKIILLDLMMPFENGFEILQKMKQDSNLSNIPVIVVSARDSREDVIKATKLGAIDYIAKPVDEAILKRKIGKYIGEGTERER
jgi:PleD family two-component response regulator